VAGSDVVSVSQTGISKPQTMLDKLVAATEEMAATHPERPLLDEPPAFPQPLPAVSFDR
jgi:hypothetical protein